MQIYGEEPEIVYADCICANCDTPAAHKFNGAAGHGHNIHPCPYCHATIVDVDKLSGYDGCTCLPKRISACPRFLTPKTAFIEKDDYQMLKDAYRSKKAEPERQEVILRDCGVRWAAFNAISGWLPSSKTVLDFMHNIFFGLNCHFFTDMIFKLYMLSGAGGIDSPKQRFENIINSI